MLCIYRSLEITLKDLPLELLQEIKTLPLYGSGQRRNLWQTCHQWTLSFSFLMESSPSASSTRSSDALITNLTGDLELPHLSHHPCHHCPFKCFHSTPRAPWRQCGRVVRVPGGLSNTVNKILSEKIEVLFDRFVLFGD